MRRQRWSAAASKFPMTDSIPACTAKSPKATERAQAAKDKAQGKVTETQAKLDAVKVQYQPQIEAYDQAMAAVKTTAFAGSLDRRETCERK